MLLVTRPPSLTDRVVTAVRDGIRDRRFVPEETYSVYQLAELLGVSRSPVREAMLKLAEAGLVEISRNRGFRVVLPDPRDVAEIFAVRLSLEPAAARRVAARGVDLATPYAALDDAARAEDEQAFWDADRAWHDAVLRGSGNGRAADIVAGLRATTALLGPPTRRSLSDVRDEHAPVVAAVLAHDPDAAEAAMRAHLTHTGRLLMAQVAGESADRDLLAKVWDEVTSAS
jgi:DNA-binding GntR family transcriptional regulator